MPDQDSEDELEEVIEQIAYRDLDIPVAQMQEPEGESRPLPSSRDSRDPVFPGSTAPTLVPVLPTILAD